MTLSRCLLLALLAATGFALLGPSQPAAALQKEKDDLPKKPGNYTDVVNLKDAPGIPPADLPRAKAAFEGFAKYNADYISHPRVYSAQQEFKADVSATAPPVLTTEQIIAELNRHILVPEPGSKIGPSQADYIRELGTALDTALGQLVRTHPERVVQINAMRLLAAACRSGAAVHYKTVTDLIANANTPPEIRYYAFVAAGHLFAAHDLNNYESRGHSNDPKVVAELIVAIAAAIAKPDLLVPPLPAGQTDPERPQVVSIIRRQAIRALAQVRFAEYAVKSGPTLYPAFTLARVAVSDPGLVPTPTQPLEVAEAVIGLCNMAPPRGQSAEQYAYAIADAVSTGILTFAGPRAANPSDRTIAWKGTAARMSEALKAWRPLWDANFNPLKPNSFDAGAVPKPIADLIAEADTRVLSKIEKAEPGTRVDVPGFQVFRGDLRANKKWGLAPFRSNPDLILPRRE